MEADEVDIGGGQSLLCHQRLDGSGMGARQVLLDGVDDGRAEQAATLLGRHVEQHLQARGLGTAVGLEPGWSEMVDGEAVGAQQRHVDAIERGAAHEADGREFRLCAHMLLC